MYARIVRSGCNVLIECDKVTEYTETGPMQFEKDEEVVMELIPADIPETTVFVMNDEGKTIDRYFINHGVVGSS